MIILLLVFKNRIYMSIHIHIADTLKIRKVDVELPDKIWAQRISYASVSYEVQAMVNDRPGPSLSVPIYSIHVCVNFNNYTIFQTLRK